MTPEGSEIKGKPISLVIDKTNGIHFVQSKRFIERDLLMGYPVRAVTKNGAAKRAGIREGDVIFKIDNRTINAPVDLNSSLRWKRPGTTVRVRVTRPRSDGNGTFTKNFDVVLGSRKRKGKAVGSLGVIHNQAKADAYKSRLVVRKKAPKKKTTEKKSLGWVGHAKNLVSRNASPDEASAKDLTEDLTAHTENAAESELMKRAQEEMSSALELMEDMKGADVLMDARRLREALRRENLKGMERGSLIVQKHLNAMRTKRLEEENAALGDIVIKKGKLVHKGKRKLNWKRVFWLSAKAAGIAALIGGGSVASYFAYLTWF